ncbi:MAG: hypothetical protein ABI867_02020 [Kofleriaceae bacterium]
MTTDRYDDLMFGLYRGVAPDWIPESRRELFLRESVRRRCALGQTLRANWRCSLVLAEAVVSDDVSLAIYARWPDHRDATVNVTTGLYLAMTDVIERAHNHALWELFQYETLVVNDLLCAPGLASRGDEVYAFRYDVCALHTHLTLYASASAPARFARELQPVKRETVVVRRKVAGRWSLEDVAVD